MSMVKSNHGYLSFFSITFLLASTFQAGWALGECGQVGLVLDKKLGWNVFSVSSDGKSESKFFNNLTITTVIASLGMGIGCYIGGSLLPRFGPRKLIIAANLISMIFNIVKLFENTAAIMISRFVFGTSMGVAAVTMSKAINDTVPTQN